MTTRIPSHFRLMREDAETEAAAAAKADAANRDSVSFMSFEHIDFDKAYRVPLVQPSGELE